MLITVGSWVAERRARLRAQRAARDDRNRLRSELASYTSPADRAELAAILARHPAAEVDQLEALLR